MPDNQSDAGPDRRVMNMNDALSARRRLQAKPSREPMAEGSPVRDFKTYEQSDGTDDYRHRMITNLAALAFLAFLIIAGWWIADTMATMQKNQDCVLSGRRGCTPVDAPIPQRW